MAQTQWLAERIMALIPQLRELGGEQEGQIAQLCQEEMAAWRARPTMRKESSLRVPMTQARNLLRVHLPVLGHNSWLNPRTGEREHLALRYLNFTDEEWARMDSSSQETFHKRQQQVQLLHHPQTIVERARELLLSDHWPDIALGLSIVTGRRLTETLKTATFHPKTAWTVVFAGQLKKKNEVLSPYEIPTLVEADLVLSSWQRLRRLVDCTPFSNDEVSDRYGAEVRRLATLHFGDLVPCRSERDDLYTHLFRSVYGRIAVHWFAPRHMLDLTYMAHVYGHYWYFEASEEKRLVLKSTMHYYEYRIGTADGHIDGRQGIRLDEPGVSVLEDFKPKQEEDTQMGKQLGVQQTIPTKVSSNFRCSQQTRELGMQWLRERRFRSTDELLRQSFDESRLYQQMAEILKPYQEQWGLEGTAFTTLQAITTEADQEEYQEKLANAYLSRRFGVNLEQMAQVFTMAKEAGHEPLHVLEDAVGKRKNISEAATQRQQRYQALNYRTMSLEELEKIKSPEAANERIRRAVKAIMRHNEGVSSKLEYWYINSAAIHALIGGRYPAINAYVQEHRAEIDAHHQQFGIELRYNRKAVPIEEMVRIPQGPDENVM